MKKLEEERREGAKRNYTEAVKIKGNMHKGRLALAMPRGVASLVEIPPKMSASYFVGYLKSKRTLMIFERHANLKYKYGNRHFWCRGYYVDTVGKNAKKIEEYIRNQLREDLEYDQMSLKSILTRLRVSR